MVDTAHLQAGQRVLITAGAGGVGHFAVQFARHLGAHMIATASTTRHPWLKELGADETIDYTTTRFEDAAVDVDIVIDLVGDAHDRTSTRSLEVLRPAACWSPSRPASPQSWPRPPRRPVCGSPRSWSSRMEPH
ncbi:zinc-binding dehydrogenase [Streptomyces cucumeris]|uniref:zinc-binding dehydrogenase n=1 Tax=Streptomyces cucumeris TaxID=2962890 RepID=UPI003D715E5E